MVVELAIIVGAILLYKAYKLKLKHDAELKELREQNARLRAQLEALRREHETVLSRSGIAGVSAELTDTQKAAQIAEAIRRKEPLL